MEKSVHLKGRLLELSRCVENSEITADIGCDHGRLSVGLLQSGRSGFVYACDISPDSLKKAEILRDKCGLSNRMCICLADGLKGVPKQPDTIIIAGMGGILIADIIAQSGNIAQNARRIVLQPMRGVAQLRAFLHENRFCIEQERLCKESGRIYQIICARYTGVRQEFRLLPDGFYEIGEMLITKRDELLPEYMKRIISELRDASSSAEVNDAVPEALVRRLYDAERVAELIDF